tara:strand:- start:1678 stop:1821 length:144 start_codon:yes stop_codon:yes gene_type:complete
MIRVMRDGEVIFQTENIHEYAEWMVKKDYKLKEIVVYKGDDNEYSNS